MLEFNIGETDHYRQVSSFVHNLLPTATRGYLQTLIKNGHVSLNGEKAGFDTLLHVADKIKIKESARTTALLGKSAKGIDILFEDDSVLLVNKEAGLSIHNSDEVGDLDMLTLCEDYLQHRGTPCKLRPVNRLDRGTSGALLFAKSPTAAGILGRYVRDHGLGKIYIVAVSGEIAAEGQIDLPLEGKESLTRYRRLFTGSDLSIAAVYPVTGRTHQIRKHFSIFGNPVIGDRRYGGKSVKGLGGHALHSFVMSFPHPLTEQEITVYAPLPERLLKLMRDVSGESFNDIMGALPVAEEVI